MTALHEADVRLLLDVRQRRGVRGSEYAWANSKRLQAALEDAGFGYRHLPELAPTTELRRLQYAEDDRQGVGKRSRTRAGARLRRALHARDPRPRRSRRSWSLLPRSGAAALFCVERDPEACHRSLIAGRLAAQREVDVTHLRPPDPA